jgi:hypothetical protein
MMIEHDALLPLVLLIMIVLGAEVAVAVLIAYLVLGVEKLWRKR